MRFVNVKYSALLALPLASLLSACVAFQVGGDIQKGRMELLYGDPKVALFHFERAAALQPDYRLNFSIFPEWVWTYVGRANLAAGMLPEAQNALERARSQDEDSLAKLYLGVVLTRQGNRDRGIKEMEAGLRGLYEWYDWVQFYHIEGQFWDPGKPLRKYIQTMLAGLNNRESNLNEMVQNITMLGRDIEIEIDRARDHRDLYWMRRYHGDEVRP